MTDLALFQKWALERDADAFREIAGRYAGLVYATCLRILRNTADAEDVTQECFEALSQMEKQPRGSVGAWLHKVATTRSLQHIRSETRRRRHEARYVAEKTNDSEVKWMEVYQCVDIAIAELPEGLRVPIVAHYLQDESYTGISHRLGVSPDTVRYRVRKGVELVRKSLRRRGVTLGTSALIAFLSSNLAEGAVVPTTLGETLGKLAISGVRSVGKESAATAGIMLLSNAVRTVMTKGALATMGVFVALLVFIYYADNWNGGDARKEKTSVLYTRVDSTGRLTQQVHSSHKEGFRQPAKGPIEDEAPKEGADGDLRPASIHGFVKDSAGFPIEGAMLRLDVFGDLGLHDVLKTHRATTDSDGHYEIKGISEFGGSTVWASATGYVMSRRRRVGGYDFAIKPGATYDRIDFALAEAKFFISGRVVSVSGQPISNASVNLQHFDYTDEMLARGRAGWISDDYKIAFSLTEKDGHFKVPVPSEGLCDFNVTKRGYAPHFFPRIQTGKTDALLVLRSSGSISGRVSLPDGTPVEGATVGVLGQVAPGGSSGLLPRLTTGVITCVTDSDGVYIAKELGEDYVYTVNAVHPAYSMGSEIGWSERFRTQTANVIRGIEVKPDQVATGVDFIIYPPACIYGKVTEVASRRPVYPVSVSAVEEVRNYLGISVKKRFHLGSVATDEDGAFELWLELDKRTELQISWKYDYKQGGSVGFVQSKSPDPKVATLDLNPAEEKELNFSVPAAPMTIPIRYVDRNGVPIEGIRAGMRVSKATKGTNCRDLQSNSEGRVTWRSLPPNETYRAIGVFVDEPHAFVLGVSDPFTGNAGDVVSEVVIICSAYNGFGGVAGIVRSVDGQLLRDAEIKCHALLEDGKLSDDVVVGGISATTKSDGAFVILDALPNGIHPKLILSCEVGDRFMMASFDYIMIEVDHITNLGAIHLQPGSVEEAIEILSTK